jgi:hypothetical protein
MTCSGEAEPRSSGVRALASYGFAKTALVWPSAPRTAFERHAVLVGAEKRFGDRTTIQLGSGAIVDGALADEALGPGWLFFSGISHRIVDGYGAAPFVLASATLSALSARAGAAHLTAFDARGGLTMGKTIGAFMSPYLAARAFGGPVYWRGLIGTDLYHYQLAVGASVALGAADVFAEWAFVGERAIALGVGLSF